MIRVLALLCLLFAPASTALAYRQPPSQEEMASLNQQIFDRPDNARLLETRGLDYAVLGDKNEAIADFKAAQKNRAEPGSSLLDLRLGALQPG